MILQICIFIYDENNLNHRRTIKFIKVICFQIDFDWTILKSVKISIFIWIISIVNSSIQFKMQNATICQKNFLLKGKLDGVSRRFCNKGQIE